MKFLSSTEPRYKGKKQSHGFIRDNNGNPTR